MERSSLRVAASFSTRTAKSRKYPPHVCGGHPLHLQASFCKYYILRCGDLKEASGFDHLVDLLSAKHIAVADGLRELEVRADSTLESGTR